MNLPESYQKATRIMKRPLSELQEKSFDGRKGVNGIPETSLGDLKHRGPIESGEEPNHLLWALIHLKVYLTVEIHCSITGWPSAKTFSKWAWYFIERIADLKDDVICLGNRFDGLNGIATTNCFISVDGTDCPAYEPWPFSRQMYSHKLNGPGIKYEVGVCLKTGWIVWINGPFVGSENDATIFKEGLSTLLHDDEGVEVDRGYKGDDKMKLPGIGVTSKQRKMKANARAQHETKHGMCFNAVAVITQLKFASGETTFDDGLEYDVNYF
eukprot:jgi/Psemu1/1811/gm1.1811_g